MRREFLDLLACPACGARLIAPPSVNGGGLLCEACTCRFTTPDGMPVLLVGKTTAEDTTARAFAAQWRLREGGCYEHETLYGETAEQELGSFLSRFSIGSASALNGKTVLDIGCGSGRLTQNLARLAPAALVVGGDRSDSAWIAYKRCAGETNALVVQMDLYRAPFRPQSFDYVYADGVLPHVPDPMAAMQSLDRLVRPGGKLFVWLYPRSFSPYRALRDVLVRSYRIPLWLQRGVERLAGVPLWLAFKAYEPWRGSRRRSLREILFMLHDNLAPEFQHRRRPEEMVAAFEALGYVGVQAVGPPTGVVGTKPPSIHR